MRTFEHFPKEIECVICHTSEDRPCTLLPIYGTENGRNCEAQPVHVECVTNLPFRIMKGERKVVYAVLEEDMVELLDKATEQIDSAAAELADKT